MQDDKYVHFKRDEWKAFKNNLLTATKTPDEIDGFLIRPQDIAAAGGLRGYANGLMIVTETLASVGKLDDLTKQNLHRSIEAALTRADEADTMLYKIPD